jgi:hypothetical protein
MQKRVLAKLFGCISLIAGLLMMYVALPIAIGAGTLAVLLTVLLVGVFIITGVFLISDLSTKSYVQSLAFAGCAEVVVGLVFFAPFSLEIKLLAVNMLLIVAVITARYFAKHRIKASKLADTHIVGEIALILVGGVLLYLAVSFALPYGFFASWFSSWPIFLIIALGFSHITKIKFVETMKRFFIVFFVFSIPWIVVLPREFQIASGAAIIAILLWLLYLAYRKHETGSIVK